MIRIRNEYKIETLKKVYLTKKNECRLMLIYRIFLEIYIEDKVGVAKMRVWTDISFVPFPHFHKKKRFFFTFEGHPPTGHQWREKNV